MADEDIGKGDKPRLDGKMAKSLAEARRWSREITAARKWMADFTRNAAMCEKAYMDQRQGDPQRRAESQVNLFWSNVQVTLAAIYGRLPRAEVDRKFRDYDDDVSRVAAEILQRVLNSDIEREHDDTNAAMRDAVHDRFVVGMGQVWCRYEVETEQQPVLDPVTQQPMLGPDGKPLMQERIISEEAQTDFVHWRDFLYSPCRRWRDCRWVARRVPMSEKAMKARFKLSKEQLAMIPMSAAQQSDSDSASYDVDSVEKATPYKQAWVWEIWCKDTNYVYWYVEGCSFVLDMLEDPLQLDDFFPCPQPVVATTLTRAFLPRADYAMAQDLYKELDTVNRKISRLTDAVRATGAYDKKNEGLKALLSTGGDNQLIPVENWARLAEAGGLAGAIDWLPIEQFVKAISELSKRKMQLEKDLYELLGISDIMRGASVASETATAQQLKVQYGGARLAALQAEVARFVSAVSRIRANIICNHFQPETLVQRSLIDRVPADQPYVQPAIELLKNFGRSMLHVNVEADSMAAPDWQAEKEQRTELLTAISSFLSAALPIVQVDPKAGTFMLKMLQFTVAGYKSGRQIEGVIDQAVRSLEQAVAQNEGQQQQPSPEDKKNDASARKYNAEAEEVEVRTAGAKAGLQAVGLLPSDGAPPVNGAMPPLDGGAMPQPML